MNKKMMLSVVLLFIVCDAQADDSFGKTHFIVGYDHTKIAHQQEQAVQEIVVGPLTMRNGRISQAFFAPDDNIQQLLIDLIDQEKKAIYIAVFMLTDSAVAKALVRARERGVMVQVIADQAGMEDRFGKMRLLRDNKIELFVYNTVPSKKTWSNIMHNKFILFASNLLDKSLVWTGSLNLTKSAHMSNQENVVVLDDAYVFDQYAQQFERIKERCLLQKNNEKTAVAVSSARRNKFGHAQQRNRKLMIA